MSSSTRAPRKRSGTRSRFHGAGRCGSTPSASPRRRTPPKPMTAACQRPPMVARCRPRAALPMLSARSIVAGHAEVPPGPGRPRPAAPPRAAWMPGDKRAAVHGDGLVVVVVGARHAVVDLVAEHVAQHHHVRLLDHLGVERHVAAEEQVGGLRPRREQRRVHVGQVEEAGELLEEARLRVEAVGQAVGHAPPGGALARRHAEAPGELLGCRRRRAPRARRTPPAPCAGSSAPARW